MEWERSSSNDVQANNEAKTSLIINYLPQSVKEQDFTELFAMIGPLKSAKLMYDRETGYSFGYGFVEYISPTDAVRAIETYNGYIIKHKRLKVAFSRPNTEETKNTTLYIKNLPESYDDEALISLIEPYGEIVQARVIRNQSTGQSRGIAFVIMATKREANESIRFLNGEVPPNASLPLIVKLTDQDNGKRINRNRRSNASSLNNIFQGRGGQSSNYSRRNMNYGQSSIGSSYMQNSSAFGSGAGPMDPSWAMLLQDNNVASYPYRLQEWLQFLASGTGRVLPDDPTTGIASYLQYMAYLDSQNQLAMPPAGNSSQYSIQSAISAALNPVADLSHYSSFSNSMGNRQMDHSSLPPSNYKRARSFNAKKSKDSDSSDHILYVYGLRQFATESELIDLFSPFGSVQRVDIVMDNRTQKAKGFAFVLMDNKEDAEMAVQALNGQFHNGKNLQVRFRN